MSNIPRVSPLELVERYIKDDLSENEAKQLLELAEKNDSVAWFLYQNIKMDVWLDEYFTAEREVNEVEVIQELLDPDYCILNTQQENGSFPPAELFWNELPMESAEQTLDFSSQNEPGAEESGVITRLILWYQKWKEESTRKGTRKAASLPKPEKTAKEKRRANFFFAGRLILFVAAVTWLALQGWQELSKEHVTEFKPVARITETVDVVWENESRAFKRGQGIAVNELELRSGLAQIEFKNGTNVILEGPGKFVVNSEKNLLCLLGRVSAHVSPQGIGFEVNTPYARFVDRGTKFAVEVDQKESKIDVVQGVVDLIRTDQSAVTLVEGTSSAIDAFLSVREYTIPIAGFISETLFQTKVNEYVKQELQKRDHAAQQLNRHPALLARFDFTQKENGILSNLSARTVDNGFTAQITGCHKSDGEFHRTNALGLSEQSDTVSTNATGQFDSMTLSAKVRLDNLRNQGNTLFCCDDYSNKSGTFLWQILKDGRVQIQVHARKSTEDSTPHPEYFQASSSPCITPQLFNTWARLVVVVDSQKRRISHYLDGLLINSVECPEFPPFQLSGGTIGNYYENGTKNIVRNFNGAIVDFALYDRALTPEEIKTL